MDQLVLQTHLLNGHGPSVIWMISIVCHLPILANPHGQAQKPLQIYEQSKWVSNQQPALSRSNRDLLKKLHPGYSLSPLP